MPCVVVVTTLQSLTPDSMALLFFFPLSVGGSRNLLYVSEGSNWRLLTSRKAAALLWRELSRREPNEHFQCRREPPQLVNNEEELCVEI